MSSIVIYHNPACGTSRTVLAMLTERRADFKTVEYLNRPLTRADFERIIAILDSPPAELVRKDKRFKELDLDAANYVDAKSVIALLIEHPELMQRPILVKNGQAIIARPAERAAQII